MYFAWSGNLQFSAVNIDIITLVCFAIDFVYKTAVNIKPY